MAYQLYFYDVEINHSFEFPVNKGGMIEPKLETHTFIKNTRVSAIDQADKKVYNFYPGDRVENVK